MLLTKKTRQEYLRALGYYNGAIDGIEGPKTKKAYKDLQNKYFSRKQDKDGLYGKNTDILLRSAYNCRDLKYFKLEEFRCTCGGLCTGYPAEINRNLVVNLDSMRKHYGKSTTITSGLRCSKYNTKKGGVWNSRHKTGKAVDIYISGISDTFSGRKGIVDYWIETYSASRYAYCNGYDRTKTRKGVYNSPTMGNATHVDVN